MKKILLILLILVCGCSRNDMVETVVEKSNNIMIAINYPTTGINNLDKTVNEYIKTIYDTFKEEYQNYYSLLDSSELNIDYKYLKVDKYTSIVLYTYINTSKLEHPINEVKTFVYKKNKMITIKDLIKPDKLNELIPYIKESITNKYKACVLNELIDKEITSNYENYQDFSIDSSNLTLYFNPYKISSGGCNVISIDIPLSKLDIYFDEKNENHKETIKFVNNIIDPTKKVVAITFDDGPSNYTNKILEILERYNSSATFFVLGNKANHYQDTLINILASGSEIGNHSYNHKWLSRLDIKDIKIQIDDTQKIIKSLTGYTPSLLRPTYGSVNSKVKNATDLPIVLWDVDSNDWKIKNSKTIAKRVLKDVSDMDIILFHDTYERTLRAIEIIIPELINQGYQLVTVSELNEVKLIRSKLER